MFVLLVLHQLLQRPVRMYGHLGGDDLRQTQVPAASRAVNLAPADRSLERGGHAETDEVDTAVTAVQVLS